MKEEEEKEYVVDATLEGGDPSEIQVEITPENLRATIGDDGRFYVSLKVGDRWNGVGMEPEMALLILNYLARVAMSTMIFYHEDNKPIMN